MFRRFVEGRPDAVRRLEAIAGIAHAFVEAARDGDVERCGVLLAEEGELRAALAPSVTTAEIRAAAKAARRAGAIGLKVCGAGGGGCVVAVAERGRRDDVAEALVGSGVELLDFAPSRTGVRVRRLGLKGQVRRLTRGGVAGSQLGCITAGTEPSIDTDSLGRPVGGRGPTSGRDVGTSLSLDVAQGVATSKPMMTGIFAGAQKPLFFTQ